MTLSCFEHSLKQQLKIQVNLLVNRQVQLKQDWNHDRKTIYISPETLQTLLQEFKQLTYFFGVFNIQHRSGFTVAKARDSYSYF